MNAPRALCRTALGIELSADSGRSGSAVTRQYHNVSAVFVGDYAYRRTQETIQNLRCLLRFSRETKPLNEISGAACDLCRTSLNKRRCLYARFLCPLAELVKHRHGVQIGGLDESWIDSRKESLRAVIMELRHVITNGH